jgi:hypothetical protein
MRIRTAAFALLLIHGLAAASGYQGWQFGITQAQVKAVDNPDRYYTFQNGDVGAGNVPRREGNLVMVAVNYGKP